MAHRADTVGGLTHWGVNPSSGVRRRVIRLNPWILHEASRWDTHLGLPLNSGDSPAVIEAYADTLHFVLSLMWEHRISLNRAPPRRRKGYPSFSWAGWAGVASLNSLNGIQRGSFKSMIQIQREPGTASDLSAPPEATLYLEADIIQGQIEVSEDPTSKALHTSFHSAFMGSWTSPILLPGDFLDRHKDSSCPQHISVDCMIIGSYLNGGIYIMLIEYHGEIAERVSVVFWSTSPDEEGRQSLNKTRRRICLG